VNDLIAANERLTQELARQRATEAALRVPDAIVTGDRIQLQQVVLNLHGDWVRAPSSSDTRDVSGRSPTMPRRHVLVLHSTRASRSRLASTLIKTN
jgi:C4-dicarboxylate-specific signal transduction histidine kinase